MSLLSGASTWTNDDDSNKKRTPSLRRTIKKQPSTYNSPDQQSQQVHSQQVHSQHQEYVSEDQNYQELKHVSMDETASIHENRSARVNQLLDKMTETTAENTGAGLVNFSPPQNPELSKKGLRDFDDDLNRRPIDIPMPIVRKEIGDSNYSANNINLARLSNYQTSYETPAATGTYYSKMGLGHGSHGGGHGSDKVMEKINYLIHMLETERDEKNDTIIQDLMLYTFLGVFIIFIVDSFSRGGKYVR